MVRICEDIRMGGQTELTTVAFLLMIHTSLLCFVSLVICGISCRLLVCSEPINGFMVTSVLFSIFAATQIHQFSRCQLGSGQLPLGIIAHHQDHELRLNNLVSIFGCHTHRHIIVSIIPVSNLYNLISMYIYICI